MNTKFGSLELYFDAIRTIKPLSPEAIKELWNLSRTDKKAFDKIVEQNYKLVIPIAKRFMKSGMDIMDLIEEGNIGLMKAVEKFDVTKGVAFSTYAVYWIEQYVRKAVENQLKTIRIPSHIWDALNRWIKTKIILRGELNREPTDDDVAKKLKLNRKQIDDLRRFSTVFNGTYSLEMPMSEDSNIQLKDTISDVSDKSPESVTEIIRTREDISIALNDLSDREREIIRMRFGLGGIDVLSLDAIGEIFHISRERVRQLELRAFKKLKGILEKYNFISPQEAQNIKLDSRSGKDRRKETILSLYTDKRFNTERRSQWI
ncbi:MAG: RNA polymerase sigma factor RpoD/SigA [Endomicrobium sp.]|jgi:RNA polymerase primary sigma factor|uniref:sigma-70 family RNA polymerase sigma factor n=1 Tax=Candidatus Endomicrobiellum cubanum TaxID=3242325 RepID=UPI002836A682|nr:RNA polymerase sigma factor RpoD/SigA [Endomicrobium sp.]